MATYHVSDATGNDTTGDGSSGSPWKTIQKAADNANAGGDIVYIKADGDYADFQVKYSGSSSSTTGVIWFIGTPAGSWTPDGTQVVVDAASTAAEAIDLNSCDSLAFQNFHLKNSTQYALYASGTSYGYFENIQITGCSGGIYFTSLCSAYDVVINGPGSGSRYGLYISSYSLASRVKVWDWEANDPVFLSGNGACLMYSVVRCGTGIAASQACIYMSTMAKCLHVTVDGNGKKAWGFYSNSSDASNSCVNCVAYDCNIGFNAGNTDMAKLFNYIRGCAAIACTTPDSGWDGGEGDVYDHATSGVFMGTNDYRPKSTASFINKGWTRNGANTCTPGAYGHRIDTSVA